MRAPGSRTKVIVLFVHACTYVCTRMLTHSSWIHTELDSFLLLFYTLGNVSFADESEQCWKWKDPRGELWGKKDTLSGAAEERKIHFDMITMAQLLLGYGGEAEKSAREVKVSWQFKKRTRAKEKTKLSRKDVPEKNGPTLHFLWLREGESRSTWWAFCCYCYISILYQQSNPSVVRVIGLVYPLPLYENTKSQFCQCNCNYIIGFCWQRSQYISPMTDWSTLADAGNYKAGMISCFHFNALSLIAVHSMPP